MNRMAQWLNQNPWLNLVFLGLGIAGIVTSVFLYIKSKREKRPCFNKQSYVLVQDRLSKIDAIQILYRGQSIRNLTLTKLAIWNGGRDPIDRQDVAPTDPIRIEIVGTADLLSSELTHSTTRANNFSIQPDLTEKKITISFDYFGRNEGILLDIYHTGWNDDVVLKGTVKGVSKFEPRLFHTDSLSEGFIELVEPIFDPIDRIERFPLIYWPIRFVVTGIILPFLIPLLCIDKLLKRLRPVPSIFGLQ